MIAQEPQVVLVQQDTSSLHFDPLERVTHHLHEQSEVGQELSILLRLRIAGQHDSVAAIVAGKLQPFQVVLQVEVKERQVVVHLVLIGITVHFAHAKGAVIDAVAVRNNNRKGLNFHNMFSFQFMPCMFTIRSSIF